MQLYLNIKNRRNELNMTQTELAHKLGYADKSMIAKIEKGSVDLPQSKIYAFAKALQTTPADLMGWEDENEKSPPKNDGLSEARKTLLEYAKSLSEDEVEALLVLLRVTHTQKGQEKD